MRLTALQNIETILSLEWTDTWVKVQSVPLWEGGAGSSEREGAARGRGDPGRREGESAVCFY